MALSQMRLDELQAWRPQGLQYILRGPIAQVKAQAVLRLLILLQIDPDADKVRGACSLAPLAADAILHTRRRCYLPGGVHGGGHHLEHIRRASAHAQGAADARVVDLHGVGAPSYHTAVAPLHKARRHPKGHTSGHGRASEGSRPSGPRLWRKGANCRPTGLRHRRGGGGPDRRRHKGLRGNGCGAGKGHEGSHQPRAEAEHLGSRACARALGGGEREGERG
mmetsp:Transcript_17835/g.36762  ORF Transcript_17835/g.36762 Transcript_17835/m.36762 type:complete len:222 (+) Transcript_17835:127-792(+)